MDEEFDNTDGIGQTDDEPEGGPAEPTRQGRRGPMAMQPRGFRVGVYVDVENTSRNGGRGMRFDVLRKFSCRQGGIPIRLNAYLAFDEERAVRDLDYRDRENRFQSAVRDFGYKVYRKPVQWYTDDEGKQISKANTDLDMAVDMLLQSGRLEQVVLVTGDGDFTKVVQALQNYGCRVELVAFRNVSLKLRREADFFIPGFLIPGLLPSSGNGEGASWGEIGSRVRGVCYHFDSERQFGFLRYLENFRRGDLVETDTRLETSPYASAFFHVSDLPPDVDSGRLPNRDTILEFSLTEGKKEGEIAAADIDLAHSY